MKLGQKLLEIIYSITFTFAFKQNSDEHVSYSTLFTLFYLIIMITKRRERFLKEFSCRTDYPLQFLSLSSVRIQALVFRVNRHDQIEYLKCSSARRL